MGQTGKGFRGGRRRLLVAATLSAALGAVELPAQAQSLRGKPRSKIGVIGSGHIGGTIGGLWVSAGHPVMFSSRHPEELKPLVEKLGPLAQAGTVAQALAFADVVLLAVPYSAVPELGRQNDWKGKIVLDATNAISPRDGAIVDEAKANGIGVTTAKYLPGARIVRVFNFTSAATFQRESNRTGLLMAVPLAGNDAAALMQAGRLVRDAGFQPVVVGGLSSADRFAPGGKLYHVEGTEAEFRKAMAQYPAP